jgi:hypothetical protein
MSGETDRCAGVRGGDAPVVSTLTLADGVSAPETVARCRARYRDDATLVVDVVPARPGFASTMTVRAVSDRGELLDTVTLVRRTST